MTDQFALAAAAQVLAGAWCSGQQLVELPAAIRPRTLAEGYDIQDRLMADLGIPAVGWKLGVGSWKAKHESGVGRSIAGRLLKSPVFGSSETVKLPNAAPATIEFEFAYVLSQDILPSAVIEDVRSVIASACVTFEVVLSRFVGWPSAGRASRPTMRLSAPWSSANTVDLSILPDVARTLVVAVDGTERARAAAGDDETLPLDALADLIAIARERNMALPRGSLVSTGSMSAPFTIAGPAEIEARFLERSLRFATRIP